MKASEFRNGTGYEFKDISSEEYRIYVFPDMMITINAPLLLHVSSSGGHRVLDANGCSNYIPAGWRQIQWKVYDDKPHFVF
jgi:hypothetical protein